METIITGPSLSLNTTQVDDFLNGSSETPEERSARFGIMPEGTLKVDSNASNTYENTASSVVSNAKLALKAFFSMPIGNGELSVVRNGLSFQLPLGNV